jgi:hypothetical protein
MPEHQVFAKRSPKRSFLMTENEGFGLVFTKTRVYKFGHRAFKFGHWGEVPVLGSPGSRYTSGAPFYPISFTHLLIRLLLFHTIAITRESRVETWGQKEKLGLFEIPIKEPRANPIDLCFMRPFHKVLTYTEPVLLNDYVAPALIPRNEFRQPM